MQDRKTPRIILPIEPSLLAAIDDWRYANRVPSRAEAIRQAIRKLTETTKPAARKPK